LVAALSLQLFRVVPRVRIKQVFQTLRVSLGDKPASTMITESARYLMRYWLQIPITANRGSSGSMDPTH